MAIGKIRRNFGFNFRYRRSILDKTINIKDLLKFVGVGALIVALIFVIILIPYLIGRSSVNCDAILKSKTNEENNSTVVSATSLINKAAETSNNLSSTQTAQKNNEQKTSKTNETSKQTKTSNTTISNTTNTLNKSATSTTGYDESIEYLRTDQRVATKYSDIDIDLVDFESQMRGVDWGTISEIKVSIKNNQDKIIIPYNIKTKIYDSSSYGHDWWDAEISIRKYLNIIPPDSAKILTIPVHISFSSVKTEKKLAIYLFDEVNKQMAQITKVITITNTTYASSINSTLNTTST